MRPAIPPSGFSLIPLGTNFAGHVTYGLAVFWNIGVLFIIKV
jgi:hypothetical protein